MVKLKINLNLYGLQYIKNNEKLLTNVQYRNIHYKEFKK